MVASVYNILPLECLGGCTQSFNLGSVSISVTTKFNYTMSCWVIDILDANQNLLIAGLPLVPNVDILTPYPDMTSLIGALVPIENNVGDYKNLYNLGSNLQLLWFPVGTKVSLPT